MKKLILILLAVGFLNACAFDEGEMKTKQGLDSEWKSAFVEANGIRLHYWRTETPDRPVWIMAHGITDYGLNWTSLARRFEEEYDIIMYDARGHGYSDRPEAPYDLDSHVADLIGLIDALEVEKPILMGHSMGGGTVAVAAARHPEIPRAVILEDPADMLTHQQKLNPEVIPNWKTMIEADRARGKAGLILTARSERHKGWTDLDYDLWAESKLLVHPNVVDILEGDGFGDAVETYSRITAPTLILKADADPAARKEHQEIAARLDRGKLVHIEGAGHVIRNDRPAETEKEIRKFLAGLKESSSRGEDSGSGLR